MRATNLSSSKVCFSQVFCYCGRMLSNLTHEWQVSMEIISNHYLLVIHKLISSIKAATTMRFHLLAADMGQWKSACLPSTHKALGSPVQEGRREGGGKERSPLLNSHPPGWPRVKRL
jgi:hypothetical protein